MQANKQLEWTLLEKLHQFSMHILYKDGNKISDKITIGTSIKGSD